LTIGGGGEPANCQQQRRGFLVGSGVERQQ